jgi:hypothetical protein
VDAVPDQALDMGDEGRLILELELEGGFYNIKIVTQRGSTFDTQFVA